MTVPGSNPPERAGRLGRDFGTRLASGVVLAAASIGLTWSGVMGFGLLVLAVTLIVAWEWGVIVRQGGIDTIFVLNALVVIVAVGLAVVGQPALGLLAVLAGAILAALLGFGRLGHMSALGVLYAGLPAVGLVWIRSGGDYGFAAALFILLCVWASDTGAYLAGRLIGGPKLMPRVSPNKTWAGLAGAVLSSVATAAAFGLAMPALPFGRLLLGGLALALVSQAGDLMESALKRWYGVKDASHLIPGHGGFMDRVDGLILAAVAAGVLAAWINIQEPARALLSGL